MKKMKARYFIENGKLFCSDECEGTYEVVCTVETFLKLLEMEDYEW